MPTGRDHAYARDRLTLTRSFHSRGSGMQRACMQPREGVEGEEGKATAAAAEEGGEEQEAEEIEVKSWVARIAHAE